VNLTINGAISINIQLQDFAQDKAMYSTLQLSSASLHSSREISTQTPTSARGKSIAAQIAASTAAANNARASTQTNTVTNTQSNTQPNIQANTQTASTQATKTPPQFAPSTDELDTRNPNSSQQQQQQQQLSKRASDQTLATQDTDDSGAATLNNNIQEINNIPMTVDVTERTHTNTHMSTSIHTNAHINAIQVPASPPLPLQVQAFQSILLIADGEILSVIMLSTLDPSHYYNAYQHWSVNAGKGTILTPGSGHNVNPVNTGGMNTQGNVSVGASAPAFAQSSSSFLLMPSSMVSTNSLSSASSAPQTSSTQSSTSTVLPTGHTTNISALVSALGGGDQYVHPTVLQFVQFAKTTMSFLEISNNMGLPLEEVCVCMCVHVYACVCLCM
jgi:flagellar motor switch/type III secretory pathway protein FliN